MSTEELIREIKNHRRWILIAGSIVLFGTFIYTITKPFIYRSTVHFFLVNVEDSNPLKYDWTNQKQQAINPAPNGNRLVNMAKSSEMLNCLIKRFHLYEHYHISPNSPTDNAMVIRKLNSSIIIEPGFFSSLSLTVYDTDKLIACEMANEIVRKLDEMNKDFIVTGIRRKIKIYDQLIHQTKTESSLHAAKFEEIITACSNIIDRRNYSTSPLEEPLNNLRTNLSLLTKKIIAIDDDYLQTKNMYELELASAQKENLPAVSVINYALPDNRSPWVYSFFWAFASCVLTLCTVTGIIYLIREYNYLWQRFIKS